MNALLEDLQQALRAARNILASSSRDWSRAEDDAFLWGILVGWDAPAFAELTEKFHWSDITVNTLRELRRGIWRVQAMKLEALGEMTAGLKVPESEEEKKERLGRGVGGQVDFVMQLVAALYGPDVIDGQGAELRESIAEVAMAERRANLKEIKQLQAEIIASAPDDAGIAGVAACAAAAELEDLKSRIRKRPQP